MSQSQNKNSNYGGSQKEKVLFSCMESLPSAQLYRWQHSICEKHMGLREVLLGTRYRNTLRTWWEHCGNPKKLQKERIWCHFGACCAFSLVAYNFYFQNFWSPFSTLANTLAKNCGIRNPGGGPFTPWGGFSLVACKTYSSNWLPKNTLPIWFDFWLWPLY